MSIFKEKIKNFCSKTKQKLCSFPIFCKIFCKCCEKKCSEHHSNKSDCKHNSNKSDCKNNKTDCKHNESNCCSSKKTK